MFSVDTVVLGATLVDINTVVIVAIVAFVVGALLAFLLVTPARAASNHIARDRERRMRQLEDQARDQQDRNEQLREQNYNVLAERNHLQGQLDALRQHTVAAASAPDTSAATHSDGPSTPVARDQADQQQAATDQQAQVDQQPQQERLGERIKGFFSGNHTDNTPSQTPDATA
ncbi:MAG TPA: hypothetical protein VF116_23170 [Ktedonobacterales bacterium]